MDNPINLDFESYKGFKNIQKKNKIRKNKKKSIKQVILFFLLHKKLLGFICLIVFTFLCVFIFVVYPAYQKNFVDQSKNIYNELQKLQENDLKKIFSDSLAPTLTSDEIAKIRKSVDEFNKKVDEDCNKIPLVFFNVSELNKKLKSYCADLKQGVVFTTEILQLEIMISNLDNFISIVGKANDSDAAFAQLKNQYSQLIKNTKDQVISQIFTNDKLIENQKEVISFIEKINDEYTKLINSPKDTTGGTSSATSSYQQSVSDIYKKWRENIPDVIDKVSNDIRSNSELSSRDFLQEYNKFNTKVKFGIEDKKSII